MITPWKDRKINYALPAPYQALMQAEIDELRAALAERDAEIEQLKSIAYSDDGAGGEGMKLFLQVRAQRKVLEQALEALKLCSETISIEQIYERGKAITAIQEVL